MKNKTNQNVRGFTLIELLMVLVVASILLMFAFPGLRSLVFSRQLVGEATDVASALSFARAEATTRAFNVVMCASDDRATCSGDNNWSTGWIIFTDKDGDGDPSTGRSEILKSSGSLNGQVSMTANVSSLAFDYTGASLAGADVIFHLCAENEAEADTDYGKSRLITVNQVGSANISIGDASC